MWGMNPRHRFRTWKNAQGDEFRIIRVNVIHGRKEFRSTQKLQKKGWFGRWVTFDVEVVPSSVIISYEAMGLPKWRSKWTEAYPELFMLA